MPNIGRSDLVTTILKRSGLTNRPLIGKIVTIGDELAEKNQVQAASELMVKAQEEASEIIAEAKKSAKETTRAASKAKCEASQHANEIVQNAISSAEERASQIIEKAKQDAQAREDGAKVEACLLYTSPSPRDATLSRMPSSA